MADCTVATTHPPVLRPGTLFARLRARILQGDSRYRQMQALDKLDDRMLRDIGVSRAEVDAELRRFSRI